MSKKNSNSDDFTFIFNEDLRTGYFASNRKEGLGFDDIYSFTETKPLVFDCIQQVTGTVRDKITNEVLVGATVKVIDENNEEITKVKKKIALTSLYLLLNADLDQELATCGSTTLQNGADGVMGC